MNDASFTRGRAAIAPLRRSNRAAHFLLRCVALLFSVSIAAASTTSVQVLVPAHAATAAQGGINVEPSARPWRYVGANPDSWWCPTASSCTTSSPLARIDTEMALAQQVLVANNPSQYVSSILKPGFTAVKSTYPAVKVIEGGSINDSGTCCAWLSGVINAGGGAYFDIAAFHDYGGNYGQVVSQYRAIVGSKPIWMGEYGVSDSTGSQQSSLITAALTQTPGLAMAQFYTLRDESVYTCCPPAPTGENKLYGVVASNDVTRKSSFYTMQSLL